MDQGNLESPPKVTGSVTYMGSLCHRRHDANGLGQSERDRRGNCVKCKNIAEKKYKHNKPKTKFVFGRLK